MRPFQTLRRRFYRKVDPYLNLPEERSPYRYVDSKSVLPDWLARCFGLPERRKDRRVMRYGRIKSNILNYVTPSMFIVLLLVSIAIFLRGPVLVGYFKTGLVLNAIIVSLAIFGVLKTFHNGYLLFLASRFLKKIEQIMNREKVEESEIAALYKYLEKRAALLNTINMNKAIGNLKEFGHPSFSDTDARLIKSKLGYRVSQKKAEVNFIAGILVMLGLLGTFLGLLKTIDAVGGALASMATLGGGTGDIGLEEMTTFIGSLALPLQGMGLAFSSSLFGLSGSLLIGFFSHMSGSPQNEFIENFSRWIDERIPRFDPKKAESGAAQKPPANDELKSWIGGFVFAANRTNKRVEEMISLLADALLSARTVSETLTEMASHQHRVRETLDILQMNSGYIQDTLQSGIKQLESIGTTLDASGQELNNLSRIGNTVGQKMPELFNLLDELGAQAEKNTFISTRAYEFAKQGGRYVVGRDKKMALQFERTAYALENIASTQAELTSLMKNQEPASDVYKFEELNGLLLRLNSLLEDLNAQNKSAFHKLWDEFLSEQKTGRDTFVRSRKKSRK